MALVIDTLKYADTFERGGFEPRQARTLAAAMADAQSAAIEDLGTKQDLQVLTRRLDTLEQRIDARFDLQSAQFEKLLAQQEAKSDRRMITIIAAVVILGPVATKAMEILGRFVG